MVAMTIRLKKRRWLPALMGLALAAGAWAGWMSLQKPAEQQTALMSIGSPNQLEAETEGQRQKILAGLGLVLAPGEQPLEQGTVMVPYEFDTLFEEYNRLQQAQGLDLTPYRGQEITRYLYETADDPPRLATLLVLEGKIIGGDLAYARPGEPVKSYALFPVTS